VRAGFYCVDFEEGCFMSRPLLDTYETLKAKIPYTPLINMPTPVETFNSAAINLPELKGLWIKRDEKTNPIYGGNKVRKLEFILSDAKGKNQIVTMGAIGTNHGVATSIFCRLHGLKSRIILFDQPVTTTVIHNLKLMKINGAKLEYRGSMLSAGLHYYLAQLIPGHNYFLPPGGSNVMGCIGYVNAAFELKQQIDNGELPEPDRIICPVGSNGTLAGLTLGCQLAGLKSKVQGISVVPSHLGILPICTTKTVAQLMNRTYRFLRNTSGEVPRLKPTAIDLDDGYCGRGYGHATNEGDTAMEIFRRWGIVLESTYTAKTAAAALQSCRKNPDDTILYWHTFNSAVLDAELSSTDSESMPRALKMIVQ
jgi:1-aminocyclopropane-1-carboxylate deaminase/D-cysteine desulfhydrase-like pyridoxal-dependent ACC family enzyme